MEYVVVLTRRLIAESPIEERTSTGKSASRQENNH
jgi:hypothetical protein